MKRILTIDQGNSKVKATLVAGLRALETCQLDEASIEHIADLAAAWKPDGVIYEAVGKLDVRFAESLRIMFPDSLLLLTHATPLPLSIAYETPLTLGHDRVAAAVGASTLFPEEALLVVDAGTALTLDLVGPDPVFMGGNISPGVRMRLRALEHFTRSLPLVEPLEDAPEFGTSTSTAILAGAVSGAAAEIRATALAAAKSCGAARLVLTGGEARYVASKLKECCLPVEMVPHLVAIGLSRIFEYNEDK